jgi:aminoglycoside phosphotransferase family enzyme
MRDDLLAALADAVADAEGGVPVERHDTHGSWVFVAGARARKVKKPVVLAFLDHGSLERRRAMCREEVRLNHRLAPELYRGTVSVVAREDGRVAIDPDDEAAGAVEVAVDIRRYDEDDTLAQRLRAGAATPGQLRAVRARLAAFHASEPRPQEARRAGLLERGRRGLVVDRHGDLRTEHVLLTDPVQVVDALEFDPALRVADVACDLGFLVEPTDRAPAAAYAHEATLATYRESDETADVAAWLDRRWA